MYYGNICALERNRKQNQKRFGATLKPYLTVKIYCSLRLPLSANPIQKGYLTLTQDSANGMKSLLTFKLAV